MESFVDKGCVTVSVVMPVYNVASYVERCVQSVMNQTYPATECIIVDDASPDESITICKRLIAAYSGPTQFTILHHEKNRGLSAARNTGTDAAKSDYIYYVDSDDEMRPDCLEKMVKPVISDQTIEMVMGDCRIDYSEIPGRLYRLKQKKAEKGTPFMQNTPSELHTNQDIREWYYQHKTPRPVSVWNKLLKLSFVKDNQLYNKEGLLWEDTLWAFYLMRCLHHVVFIHEATYVYYIRSGSIAMGAGYEKRFRHFGYIFREMAEQITWGERVEETECWLWHFCNYLIDAPDNQDYQQAYKAFRRQLSDGEHRLDVVRLVLTRWFSGFWLGRLVFKGTFRFGTFAGRVVGAFFM